MLGANKTLALSAIAAFLAACSADFAQRKTLFGDSGATGSTTNTPLAARTTAIASAAKTKVQVARWDLNGDGTLTCEEWQGYLADLFGRLDLDKNGSVSSGEFSAIILTDPMYVSAKLSVFDDDRDGSISKGEFQNRPNPLIARNDKNRDCKLEPKELTSPRPQPRKAPGGRPLGGKKPF
ncbi:MAG: EF-hand domain-containing protein [Pseudomonadota bacterium]